MVGRSHHRGGRRIHARLARADGPRQVSGLAAARGEASAAQLFHAIDALWTSGQILPCDPPLDLPGATLFNRLNTDAARAGIPLAALVGRNGLMPVAPATIVAAAECDPAARAALARLGIASAG